jgi:hypothetical protein
MKVIHKQRATSNFKAFTCNCCQYTCYVTDLPSSRTGFGAAGSGLRVRKARLSQQHEHMAGERTPFRAVNEKLEAEMK